MGAPRPVGRGSSASNGVLACNATVTFWKEGKLNFWRVKKNKRGLGFVMFSELNHPEDKLQLGGGWGWEQEMLFQKLQKGLSRKKKKSKTSVGRVSGLSGNCKTNCHALPL